MDSGNESFTISSQETLLPINQNSPLPPKTKTNKNLKTILLASLILFLLIASSMLILYSISKNKQSKRISYYESRSSHYYCHLTRYHNLCYDSMSSIINTTVLESSPGLIFSTSLQVAINQLHNVSVSITKIASSSSLSNNSLVMPRMSNCRAWVHDSLNQLNESLSTLGVDSDFATLTYEEMDNVRAWSLTAKANAYKCYMALEEIKDMMVDGDEREGVEEVKLGVEKARKCVVNSISLWDERGTILDDFYNRYYIEYEYDDYSYYAYSYHYFDYRFMICFYSSLYLFLALLYYLFWRS